MRAPHLGSSHKHFFRVGQINYPAFKLFQLSMLFRASVARGVMFRNVDLGDKHTAIIREMLLNADPGGHLDYPCRLVSYEDADDGLEGICCSPRKGRSLEAGTWYEFVMGGYAWIYYVSSHQKPARANHAIRENGEITILVTSGNAFIDGMSSVLDRIDPEWARKDP